MIKLNFIYHLKIEAMKYIYIIHSRNNKIIIILIKSFEINGVLVSSVDQIEYCHIIRI